MIKELPPLPEPDGWNDFGEFYYYSADTLRAYAQAALDAFADEAEAIKLLLQEKNAAAPLTDAQIDDCMPMGMAPYVTLCGPAEIRRFARAIEEITCLRAALAQPAAIGEPPLFRQYVDQQVTKDMAPLYAAFDSAHPQPAPQPLTHGEIVEALDKAGCPLAYMDYDTDIKIARAIEAAHGITPATEAP